MTQQIVQAAANGATAEQKSRLPSEASTTRLDEPPTLLGLSRLASPTSVGAMCIDSHVNPAFVLGPLIHSVLTGLDFYGIKTEKVGKAVVLSSQELMHVMLQEAFGGQEFQKSVRLVPPALVGGADWFLPEGRALLEKVAGKDNDLMIVVMPARPRKMPLPIDQLPALIASMRQKFRAAILVFHGLAAEEMKQLPNFFGLMLNVQACEPDFGFSSAYLVSPASGTFLAGVNASPYVDNMRMTEAGKLERDGYASHASDPMTREIVKLREQGATLEAIAKRFDVERSTVLRRLQKLPYGHRRDRD